jgi:hypothetical protein
VPTISIVPASAARPAPIPIQPSLVIGQLLEEDEDEQPAGSLVGAD